MLHNRSNCERISYVQLCSSHPEDVDQIYSWVVTWLFKALIFFFWSSSFLDLDLFFVLLSCFSSPTDICAKIVWYFEQYMIIFNRAEVPAEQKQLRSLFHCRSGVIWWSLFGRFATNISLRIKPRVYFLEKEESSSYQNPENTCEES